MNREYPSTGRTVWRIIYPMLTYNGIIYYLTFLFSMLSIAQVAKGYPEISNMSDYSVFLTKASELAASYSYEIQAAAALVTIPILFLYHRMDVKRRREDGIEESVYKPVKPELYLLAAGAGLAASVVGNNLMYASGLMSSSAAYEEVVQDFFRGHLLAEVIGLGFIIPVAEELIFRGLMYSRMREILPLRHAALLCSFCFALVHGNMVQGVFAFVLGILMIYLLERYHSLLAPILVHVVSNLLAVLQQESSLLDWMYAGTLPVVLSTLVMAAALAGILYLVEKKLREEPGKS